MKVLHVHNRYRYVSGENRMFDLTVDLLRRRGHDVAVYERRSADIGGLSGRLRALRAGMYSRAAKQAFAALLAAERPRLVHVHNLLPLISPAILEACREAGLPVVMRCPNLRLTCPTGAHVRRGAACELCCGGREHWCALTNCRENLFESVAFALRSRSIRRRGLFLRNVTRYVAPSQFVRDRLIGAGVPADRIRVVPNTVPVLELSATPAQGSYVAFAGRMASDKGVETLVAAARLLPDVPVRMAGDGPLLPALARSAPANVSFVGRLDAAGMEQFYRGARLAAAPSACLEAFGLAAAEAMARGLPVVASAIGGLPEVVEDGVTGLLAPPNDPAELAAGLRRLWDDPGLCARLGRAGHAKAAREYHEDVYGARLLEVYEDACGHAAEGRAA